jgi:hypothetical protein
MIPEPGFQKPRPYWRLIRQKQTHTVREATCLGRSSGKEVVHLLVDADRAGKILLATNLRLDKMVTMNGSRYRRRVHTSGHELEKRHLQVNRSDMTSEHENGDKDGMNLSRSILAGDTLYGASEHDTSSSVDRYSRRDGA